MGAMLPRRRCLDHDRSWSGRGVVDVPRAIVLIRDQPWMSQVGASHLVFLTVSELFVQYACSLEIEPVEFDGLLARVDERQAGDVVAILRTGTVFLVGVFLVGVERCDEFIPIGGLNAEEMPDEKIAPPPFSVSAAVGVSRARNEQELEVPAGLDQSIG